MAPSNLITTAWVLFNAALQEINPEQAQTHLKRAVSSAYYAMFHAVCANAAELLPGGATDPATVAAWLQAYRGLEHSHARSQCRNASVIAPFPAEIKEFASVFVETQGHRNRADYNPLWNFSPSDVDRIINRADLAINLLASTPAAIRRAFAIAVLLRNRAD